MAATACATDGRGAGGAGCATGGRGAALQDGELQRGTFGSAIISRDLREAVLPQVLGVRRSNGSGAACGAAAASKRFCIAIGKLADEEGLKSLALVAVEAVELSISTFRRLALLLSGSRSARFSGAGRLSLFQPVAFR